MPDENLQSVDDDGNLPEVARVAFNAGVEAAAAYHDREAQHHRNTLASNGTGMAARHEHYAARLRDALKPVTGGFRGFDVDKLRRDEFARLIAAETASWRTLIKETGIRGD